MNNKHIETKKLNEGIFSRKSKEQEDYIDTFFNDLHKKYGGNATKMLYCLNYLIFNKYAYELCSTYMKKSIGSFDKKESYAITLSEYFYEQGKTDKAILDFYYKQLHIDGELGQEVAADMIEQLYEYGWPSYIDKLKESFAAEFELYENLW